MPQFIFIVVAFAIFAAIVLVVTSGKGRKKKEEVKPEAPKSVLGEAFLGLAAQIDRDMYNRVESPFVPPELSKELKVAAKFFKNPKASKKKKSKKKSRKKSKK